MTRALGTENTAQVVASVVSPVVFVELDFVGAPVRAHTGVGAIVWNSTTWYGVGDFGGMSEISEGTDVSARGVGLTINGIPSSLLNHALAALYRGRSAKLWLGFVGAAGALVADPYQTFGGRMDVMTINDTGDTCSISVQCENRMIDLRRPRASRYTHEEQKARYPDDNGLSFISRMADMSIYWGVQNTVTAPANQAPTRLASKWTPPR